MDRKTTLERLSHSPADPVTGQMSGAYNKGGTAVFCISSLNSFRTVQGFLFPRATSQVAACRHLATAERGQSPVGCNGRLDYPDIELQNRSKKHFSGTPVHIDQSFPGSGRTDQRLAGALHGKLQCGTPGNGKIAVHLQHVVIQCNLD